MANWQKVREEKRLAEIEQQRQDRENEAIALNRRRSPNQNSAESNETDNPPLN